MKFLIPFFVLLSLSANRSSAQTFSGLDKSPLDIAYYPDNFAHDRKQGDRALVRVTYSRPYRNNRKIFGGIIPFGKVWRTGANETTEIKFYEDAIVGGKRIPKGTYSLFTVPAEDSWTIVLNSDLDYWGAYQYNEKKDVLRISVPVEKSEREVENFSIKFSGESNERALMMMAWGDTLVKVPIDFEH